MSATIRLRRAGSKKNAAFHVVVADSRTPRDGRFIEKLGMYQPRMNPSVFEVKQDRVEHWLKMGAKTTKTIDQLLAKHSKNQAAEE